MKRTVSLSRRTHATLPRVDKEAVSSRWFVSCASDTEANSHTGEGVDIPNRSLKPHFRSEGSLMMSRWDALL